MSKCPAHTRSLSPDINPMSHCCSSLRFPEDVTESWEGPHKDTLGERVPRCLNPSKPALLRPVTLHPKYWHTLTDTSDHPYLPSPPFRCYSKQTVSGSSGLLALGQVFGHVPVQTWSGNSPSSSPKVDGPPLQVPPKTLSSHSTEGTCCHVGEAVSLLFTPNLSV